MVVFIIIVLILLSIVGKVKDLISSIITSILAGVKKLACTAGVYAVHFFFAYYCLRNHVEGKGIFIICMIIALITFSSQWASAYHLAIAMTLIGGVMVAKYSNVPMVGLMTGMVIVAAMIIPTIKHIMFEMQGGEIKLSLDSENGFCTFVSIIVSSGLFLAGCYEYIIH